MKRYPGLALLLLLQFFAVISSDAQTRKKAPTNEECLACHSDTSLAKDVDGKQVSLHVDDSKFKASPHAGFNCVDCHTEIKSAPHEPVTTKPQCATCHADEQSKYDHGFHAKAIAAGNVKAASCQDCHGNVHELLPGSDPASRVNRKNIAATCGTCHNNATVMTAAGLNTAPFRSYEDSVHGQAVRSGKENAAVCTDCHNAHDILRAGEPASPIFKFNVPATCGKCHSEENRQYSSSIHGVAVWRGNWNSPVCTDCHGIHDIRRRTDPSSSVAGRNLTTVTCAKCHESVKLTTEFGIVGRRLTTYLSSYHGMATKMGSTVAADCASCHTAHNILPSSNPNSSINHANLAKTCGQCHPGANEKFVQGKVHLDASATPTDTGSRVYGAITRFYVWLIVLTIGGMLAHNLIIFRRKFLMRLRGEHRPVVRMSLPQRIQHLALLVSFFMLVFTGFALKFPDSWLAVALGNSETLRSVLHRTAGVVLIGIGLWHVIYVITTKEGRKLFRDFLPEWKDVTDLRDVMLYYLGRSDRRPEFKRFNYAEKVEYWALIWGTVIMASTGLMAWFEVGVGTRIPRWFIDIALAIHFYEAILATLAILVWHLYMVIFDPDSYPMNWSWFDGRMSFDHYHEEHPLDSDTLKTALGPELQDDGEDKGPKNEEPEGA